MIKSSRFCFVILVFMILGSTSLLAQTRVNGIIQGTVMDGEGVLLPGVTVTATSPSAMGKPSAITDKLGHYRIPALLIGVYAVEATLDGFTSAKMKDIVIHPGMTATVNLVLVQATLSKDVTVIGAAPIIDVTESSMARTNISKELLDALPTAHNTHEIINLAPGVTEFSAYGAGDQGGNTFNLDGFEVSSVWFGGGQYAAPIDYSVVEETQIIALGAPAEYGGFTGSAVNIITKSGGNVFHGDAQVLGYGKSWHNENITKGDPEWKLVPETQIVDLVDTSFHLGGPIMQDKIWFFTGLEYYKTTTKLESSGKVSPITFPKYFAKLSFQPTPSNRIQAYFEYHERTARQYSLSPLIRPEANWNNIWHVWIANLSYLHSFSSNSFLELTAGATGFKWESIPSSGNKDLSGHSDMATGEWTINRPWSSEQPDQKYSFRGSFSQGVDNLAGTHDFKVGLAIEKSNGHWETTVNGGVAYYDLFGKPYMAYKAHPYREFAGWLTNFFIQDDWKIAHSLVINPGLRFNAIRGSIPELNKTVYKPKMGVEPRLGLVWDIIGNQKTVVKAHVGKYYEGLRSYYWWVATPARDEEYFHVGENWSTLTPWYTVSGKDLYTIDPGIKTPYMNQGVLGLEQVIGKDLSASVSFIYKLWGDFVDVVDITAEFEEVPFTDPTTGKVYTVYNQTNVGSPKYLVTNPKAGKDIGAAYPGIVQVTPERKYMGLQFTINKRFADKWQLFASYTYSKEEGSYNNAHSATSYYGLGNTGIYADPTWQINLYGRSVISPPHLLKIMASYVFPLDISLSANYNFYSGRTWTKAVPVTTVAQAQKPSLLLEPQGSSRMENVNNLDLRVEKAFHYKQIRLSLMLDVFNAFNQARAKTVYVFQGPNQGLGLTVNPPRTFKLGAKIVF